MRRLTKNTGAKATNISSQEDCIQKEWPQQITINAIKWHLRDSGQPIAECSLEEQLKVMAKLTVDMCGVLPLCTR